MAIFDAAAIAAQSGATVRGAVLVELAFASGSKRLHGGLGDLAAGGQVWQGIGALAAIGVIQQSTGGTAPSVTFTLSGTDPAIIQDVMSAATEVKGQPCRVYLQYFDEQLAPLGNSYRLYTGTMDRLTHRMVSVDAWTAELTAVSRFARRGLPPFGTYSESDQQQRYPGDHGLYLMPAMQARIRAWNPVKT
ncbi:hypothetical protein [Methylobacterium sp. JK268]